MKAGFLFVLGGALTMVSASAQVSVAKEKPGLKSDPVPRSQAETSKAADKADKAEDQQPRLESRPRNDEESSSRDSIIDLRPPRGDAKRPVDTREEDNTGVGEMKPWNPHKAMKSVEVGEYYFKDKNYKAAISRYREALEYKPKDAHATYRLGEVLERTGDYPEALQRYEEYLQILKDGPFAEECRKGIARIKQKLAS
jgi:tetratricopeptide (TPR) repeat protein